MPIRNIERFLPKRTAVSGRRPTGTTGNELSFIQQGELAVNTADHELWSFDGVQEFKFFDKTYLSFSGGTVTGETVFSSLFSTSLSGGTLYSGSTDLETIINNITNGSEDITRVQPGLNITTGGTDNFPIVNLQGDITLNSVNATSVSGGTISGDTIYSAGTDLYNIFLTTADGNDITRVQNGTNTVTGGTGNFPSVNLVDSPSFNNLSWSGNAIGNEFYASAISGGTIYSGGTDLYNIFLTTADGNDITRVQSGTNTVTGGTGNFPSVNLVDNPSFNDISSSGTSFLNNVSTNEISGGTLYSGSTDLDIIIRSLDTSVTGGTLSSGGTLSLDKSDAVTIVITGFSTSDQVIKESGLLDVYQSITTTTTGTTGSYIDVFWDSDILVGSAYSRSSSEITMLEDGIYEITYCVSVDVNSGGRKSSRCRIVLDEGSGFSEIIRSGSFGYHRSSSNGEDTITKTIKQRFDSGDIIKTQMSVFAGSGSLVTVANDSNITITKMTL